MENQSLPALRPLRLGELLDQAIRLYRRNFVTFIGIIALIYVPLMILQTASSALLTSSFDDLAASTNPEELFTNYAYWGGMLSTLVVSFFQYILVQGIATGALTRAVADNYLGKTTGIVEAYRSIGKSWASLLGALFLLILLLFAVSLWGVIVPCIGWFTGLGMAAFLWLVVNPLVPPVVVLEGQGAWASIRRAWDLARRRFWPVLGTIFVLMLFSILIVNGPTAIVNVLLTQFITSFGDLTTQMVVTSVIQALVSLVFVLLYYPLQMTAFTLIYFDLRVRTEGFDLALLTLPASDESGAASVTQVPAPPSVERLVTGPDLGNFAILTLGVIGLYILFVAVIMGGVFFLYTLFP